MEKLNPYEASHVSRPPQMAERATWVNYTRAAFCLGFALMIGFVLAIWIFVGIEVSHTQPWQRTATIMSVGIVTGLVIVGPALLLLCRDIPCILATRRRSKL